MNAAVLRANRASGERMMATPEHHPTWTEVILGSALFSVILPKLLDWMRQGVLFRRKEDATVRVAEIEDDAKFRAELLARVTQLEASHATSIEQIARLQTEQSLMRRQLEGILARGEAAIGGDPTEILDALRQTLYELRTMLGHPPYPKADIIGDRERKLGDG